MGVILLGNVKGEVSQFTHENILRIRGVSEQTAKIIFAYYETREFNCHNDHLIKVLACVEKLNDNDFIVIIKKAIQKEYDDNKLTNL